MLIIWTSKLITAMCCVGLLGAIAFFLGTRERKLLVTVPLVVYCGMVWEPLYHILFLYRPWYELGAFSFDQYSFIAEVFPLLWLPVLFMAGYYYQKGKRA